MRVSKLSNPGKTIVELSPGAPRPSKIRREPPPPPPRRTVVPAEAAEREARTVVIGIVLFAMAITVIIFGFSDYLSR